MEEEEEEEGLGSILHHCSGTGMPAFRRGGATLRWCGVNIYN